MQQPKISDLCRFTGGAILPNANNLTEQDKCFIIQCHLVNLDHASSCLGCELKDCREMKAALAHRDICKNPDCRTGKRVSNLLLHGHGRICINDFCSVPRCLEMRVANILHALPKSIP